MRLEPVFLTALGVTLCNFVIPTSGRALVVKEDAQRLKRGFGVPRLGEPDPVPVVPHNDPAPGPQHPSDPAPAVGQPHSGSGGGNSGESFGVPGPENAPEQQPGFQVPARDSDLPDAFNVIPPGKDYTYNTKGTSLRDNLNAKISDSNAADIPSGDYDRRIKSYPPVQNPGTKESMDDLIGDEFNQKLFANTGVDKTKENFDTKIQYADDAGNEPLSTAYYSKDQGTIGATEKFSNYPADFPLAADDRIAQSEIVFRNWLSVAGDQSSSLKNVYQMVVDNTNTKAIIDAAMKNSNTASGDVLKIDSKNGDRMNLAAFNALAGSDNGRPVFQMCIDHPVSLGKAQPVTAFVTDQPTYAVAWVLGR